MQNGKNVDVVEPLHSRLPHQPSFSDAWQNTASPQSLPNTNPPSQDQRSSKHKSTHMVFASLCKLIFKVWLSLCAFCTPSLSCWGVCAEMFLKQNDMKALFRLNFQIYSFTQNWSPSPLGSVKFGVMNTHPFPPTISCAGEVNLFTNKL